MCFEGPWSLVSEGADVMAKLTNVMPPQPTPLGLTVPLSPTGHDFFKTLPFFMRLQLSH